MSFIDMLENEDILAALNPDIKNEKNITVNSLIDKVVLYHVRQIKESIRSDIAHEFYYYKTDIKKKIIYGKVDFLRCIYPKDGLFAFLYKYRNNDIMLTNEGEKVFHRLKTACKSDQIMIKIGKKLPQGDGPNHYRDWYENSLYSDSSQISYYDNPYQVFIGYKIVLDMTQDEIDNGKSNSSDGCYIATSVYGSYDCPEVWTLRRFRDFSLRTTWYGRAFIRVYYAVSPTMVKCFGNRLIFQTIAGKYLDCFVAHLQKEGYENKPYEDYPYQ